MTDETPQDTSGLPPIVTVDEVAARYKTSRDTVYRWVRSKSSTFPRPIPLPTSGIRWRSDALDAWDRAEAAKAQAAHSTGKAA